MASKLRLAEIKPIDGVVPLSGFDIEVRVGSPGTELEFAL